MDHQPDEAQYVTLHAPKSYHIFPLWHVFSYLNKCFIFYPFNVVYLLLCCSGMTVKIQSRGVITTLYEKRLNMALKKKITDYIYIPRPLQCTWQYMWLHQEPNQSIWLLVTMVNTTIRQCHHPKIIRATALYLNLRKFDIISKKGQKSVRQS